MALRIFGRPPLAPISGPLEPSQLRFALNNLIAQINSQTITDAQSTDFTILAAQAALNNPRIEPVMASPPAISSSASHDASLTQIVTFSDTRAAAFNYYGGAPTDDGVGGIKFVSTTVQGSLVPYVWRIETVVDAVKVEYKILDVAGAGILRFIVDGAYVQTAVTTPGISGIGYVTLDFTGVGDRAIRTIAMEANGCDFYQVAVGPTDGLQKPGGTIKRMYVVGDSFTASGGMDPEFVGYAQILGDLLGIRDLWNGGVGGTGYLNPGTGELNFVDRVNDIYLANPDLVFVYGGHNDTTYTTTQLYNQIIAYLKAIRSYSLLANTPVVIAGINGGNISTATTVPMENAIAAAVLAYGDPLVYFIPDVTAPKGPIITGTGSTASPTGSGNADVYIGPDRIHPNNACHSYIAYRKADDMARLVFMS